MIPQQLNILDIANLKTCQSLWKIFYVMVGYKFNDAFLSHKKNDNIY